MYQPAAHEVKDLGVLHALIRSQPLGMADLVQQYARG